MIFGSCYTGRTDLVDLPHNSYPLSRQEQVNEAFALAGDHIGVNVIELPYILGGALRGTLWRDALGVVPFFVPADPGKARSAAKPQRARFAATWIETCRGHPLCRFT